MKILKPGLYQVTTRELCAGFEITKAGKLGACAPVLRKNIFFWLRLAKVPCRYVVLVQPARGR